METIKAIAQYLFTPAALLAGIVFLLRKYFDSAFTKDLEQFKQNLKSETDQAKLRMESDMQLKLFEYQTRFSIYHPKYSEVIAEFYKKLVIAEQHITNLPLAVGNQKESQANEAASAFVNFSDFFNQHRIYLSEDTCKKIDFILEALGKTYIHFVMARLPKEGSVQIPQLDPKSDVQKLVEAWKNVRDKVPEIKGQLEEHFRQALNVTSTFGAPTNS